MVKNNNIKSNLNTVGKGILDTLENSVKENNNSIPESEISKSDDTYNSIRVNDDTPITSKDENSITSNTEKTKRVNIKKKNTETKEKSKSSFMLTSNATKQLKLLNLTLEKDLSDLVIDAIDLLYKKHEKRVEQTIADYFQDLKK